MPGRRNGFGRWGRKILPAMHKERSKNSGAANIATATASAEVKTRSTMNRFFVLTIPDSGGPVYCYLPGPRSIVTLVHYFGKAVPAYKPVLSETGSRGGRIDTPAFKMS